MYRYLKQDYADFMQDKISQYAQEQQLKMLVGSFISSCYMAVCQDTKNNKRYILIIENIKQPIIIELNAHLSPDDYHVCNLYQLKNKLPKEYFMLLMDRGLYMSENPQRDNTSRFAIHRLVCCIGYDDIKNTTIHHKDKDKANNSISNLVPMSLSVNIFLDKLNDEHMLLAGNMFEDIIKEGIEQQTRKKHRDTVTNNGNLHMEILKYQQQHKTIDVIKRFKDYIRTPQTIRNILHYYFYGGEFINGLRQTITPLNIPLKIN